VAGRMEITNNVLELTIERFAGQHTTRTHINIITHGL